ncbi:MAG: hypothetical protein KKC76_02375 [Proteobacteria bacterium]|nr:hypothetical protein [Pseudomonadota bacterium]MBU4296910.1 hypothetical protein [Pseudomonadota bacterium]MCG2749288.1 hypothetical protein [Desulfobulbaceae bacterium]
MIGQPRKLSISLYENYGLSEQFHSEFKSGLGLEQLPSGKFATNALIMSLGSFAYKTYCVSSGNLGYLATAPQ